MKVGVDPLNDVKKLKEKYDVDAKGTLDLRYLAEACGERPRGLQYLAETHIGMRLEKSVNRHFEWDDEHLDHSLRLYAAEDAYASIELFKHFMNRLEYGRLGIPMRPIRGFAIQGRACIDKRYIYRSENDSPNPTKNHHQHNIASRQATLKNNEKVRKDYLREQIQRIDRIRKQPGSRSVLLSSPLFSPDFDYLSIKYLSIHK